ncbi:MAG: CotH kinase family protein [Phycisphaerales bacterium]
MDRLHLPRLASASLLLSAILLPVAAASAQQSTPRQSPPDAPDGPDGGPGQGPGFGPDFGPGFGPPGMRGPGGPGGPFAQERKILATYDADKNGRLEGKEIDAAREALKKDAADRPQRGGRGPRMGGPPGGEVAKTGPGRKVTPADVKSAGDRPLFDEGVVRTIFLDFDLPDWEGDLELFHGTDVDLPATMTVDGVKYPGVGVRFRGASSYMMVPKGAKRSLNVAVDHTDPKARLLGAKTLNLLNSHEDDSMMSTVLYSHLSSPHIPTPRANFAEVVINGESWGVFVNVEQFNKDFVERHWPESKGKGARWKVNGSPMGDGGLQYKGDEVAAYKSRYEIKTKDDEKDWRALIELCRTLSQTPVDQLETALKPMLDIDSALWFLAMDIGAANGDGYWVRASDYALYRDASGVFHIVPHDMNEAFHTRLMGPAAPGGMRGMRGGPGQQRGGQGGPPGEGQRVGDGPRQGEGQRPGEGQRQGEGQRGGMRGPRGGGGVSAIDLDPFYGMDDASKPLRSRLLQVPALRAKYLECVHAIAAQMDWAKIGPYIAKERALIEPLVKLDTRKLSTTEAFERAVSDGTESKEGLRAFFDGRSKYLAAAKLPAPKPAGGDVPAGDKPTKKTDAPAARP